MFTSVKNVAVAFFVMFLLLNPAQAGFAQARYSNRVESSSNNPADLVTIVGTVKFEGTKDHRGIKVELWKDHRSSGTLGVVTTDSNGNYTFENVESNYEYSIVAAATVEGFCLSHDWVTSYELTTSGGTFSAEPMMLLREKKITFDWVYQPDGTASFVTGSPTSGSETIGSSTGIWKELGRIIASGSFPRDFCFQDGSTWSCSDFYFGINDQHLNSLWANNGDGGTHDMGEVPLASVTEAPDKSNGVGGDNSIIISLPPQL